MNNEVKSKHQNRKKSRSCFYGLQLFAVQSSACVLVLLMVLLLRLIGGSVMEDATLMFNDAMMQKPFLQVSAFGSNEPEVSLNEHTETVCAPLIGGVITSYYGEREDPFDMSVTKHHDGVDIAASEGTPLVAMLSGCVEKVGCDEGGYGNYVIVSCENAQKYLYAHCSSIPCKEGQMISQGQTVAFVGNTGKSTGSHVHIEWYEHDKSVDPLSIIPEETYA